MLWLLTRTKRWSQAPRICNVMFHLPESLDSACDCKTLCKWPPRGGPPGAAPMNLQISIFQEKELELATTTCANNTSGRGDA